MRALVSRVAGPVESLVLEDLPLPVPAAHEVRVRVRAAALNFPDVLLVGDGYQVPLPRPFVPGSELAGEVTAVGADVSTFAVGDVVAGTTMTGALADQAVVAAADLVHLAPGVDLVAAAAVGVVTTTAYSALTRAGVRPGDAVLVLGAAGGVGLAAVQLAAELGAEVVAAASSPQRLAVCRAAGAQQLVDYGSGGLRESLRALRPAGVDVVIDPVGGLLSEQALRSCARGAHFVTLGYASGQIPAIPLNLVLLKGVTVTGFDLRAESLADPARAAAVRAEVFSLFVAGRVRPHVSATFPLERAVEGLRMLADRRVIGKLVVTP